MKFIGKDGREVTVESKIDTGADSTSIGLDLARDLGYGTTVDEYLRVAKEWEELSELSREERWQMFEHIPDVISTVRVRSSNGILTYRITIRIEMEIDQVRIPAKVTLIDRSSLDYPAIIGKKNLRKFLIDVSK